jgi:hypothetical protein
MNKDKAKALHDIRKEVVKLTKQKAALMKQVKAIMKKAEKLEDKAYKVADCKNDMNKADTVCHYISYGHPAKHKDFVEKMKSLGYK